MELQQDSIIVSDRLQALFDFELRNCFTHAFVTDGECAMKYSGEEVRMEKGDCVIIIANHLVTELRPTARASPLWSDNISFPSSFARVSTPRVANCTISSTSPTNQRP